MNVLCRCIFLDCILSAYIVLHTYCVHIVHFPFQNHPPLPPLALVASDFNSSATMTWIVPGLRNNAKAAKQCLSFKTMQPGGDVHAFSIPSSGGSSVPLYSASHHCCKLLGGARQGIMPLLFIWAVYKRIMPLMQRLRPR